MLSFTDPALTVAEADTYASLMGYAAWVGDNPVKAAALQRGQMYIAATYNSRWLTNWANDEAPAEVKYAITEAAIRDITTPGSLAPDYTPGKVLKRESATGGPVEFENEYFAAAEGAAPLPVFSVIDGLLAGLLKPVYSGAGMWSIG